jgi:hypothetical protein
MTKEDIRRRLKAAHQNDPAAISALIREWFKLFPGADRAGDDDETADEWLARHEASNRAVDEWNVMNHAVLAELGMGGGGLK